MRRLTDLEARTIRWMNSVSGFVDPPDAEMAATIYALITTEFVTINVTNEGRRALLEYDQAHAEPADALALIRQLEDELGVKGTSAVLREALARARTAADKVRADLALAEQEKDRG